jgi:hypothetical protein
LGSSRNDTGKFCVQCGASLRAHARFCDECGTSQQDHRTSSEPQRLAASLASEKSVIMVEVPEINKTVKLRTSLDRPVGSIVSAIVQKLGLRTDADYTLNVEGRRIDQEPSTVSLAQVGLKDGARVILTQKPKRVAKFCLWCGKPVRSEAKFCLNCGKPTRRQLP